jgi:arginase family enzyme
VLAPGVAQAPRAAEPGGLGWYALVDLIEAAFGGPGVATADLVGCKEVQPRSPAALLAAQILIKMAGLFGAHP